MARFKEIEGVETASSGEGQDHFLAVAPAGKTDLPVAAPIASAQLRPTAGRRTPIRPPRKLAARVCHNTPQ